jgi:hypothetical protein
MAMIDSERPQCARMLMRGRTGLRTVLMGSNKVSAEFAVASERAKRSKPSTLPPFPIRIPWPWPRRLQRELGC